MKKLLIVDVPSDAGKIDYFEIWVPSLTEKRNYHIQKCVELPIPTDPEIKQMADDYAKDMIGVGGCDENMIQGNARKDYIAGANAIINILK